MSKSVAIKISNGIKTQSIKIKNDNFLTFVLLEGGPDGIKINGNSYQNKPVNINSINIDKEEKCFDFEFGPEFDYSKVQFFFMIKNLTFALNSKRFR